MAAEWISYYSDVKLLGVPLYKRCYNYFKPCKCCGWSNHNVSKFIDKEEKLKL
jgi:hypothetical protein